MIGCIVLSEKNILIIKKKDKDYWELPGAVLKEDEDMELAAKKSVYELTGLKVDIIQQFNESQSYYNDTEFLSHLFEASVLKGSLKPHEEIEKMDFFPVEELNKLKLSNVLYSVYQELTK